MKQVSRAIQGVAQGAQEQAGAVTQSAEITATIVAAIAQVTGNAKTGCKALPLPPSRNCPTPTTNSGPRRMVGPNWARQR